MLSILQDMGYSIKDRELTRMRKNMGCVFRAQTTYGQDDSNLGKRKREDRDEDRHATGPNEQLQEPDPGKQLLDAINEPLAKPSDQPDSINQPGSDPSPEPPHGHPSPDPSSIQARQSRLSALAAESAERYKSRTRRRRTRPFAGIPADPPGPPRFPSETTLEEAKIILQLDNETYSQLRQLFAQICSENDIRKKTEAGNQKWGDIKSMLVASSQHLSSLFAEISNEQRMYHMSDDNGATLKRLHVALDVLCSDVTKRLRTPSTKLPLASARNILGLNPNDARQLCGTLRNILIRDGFTSKIEAGEQHWEELKQEWIQGSELLTTVVREEGAKGKKESERLLAMETLARDVMKRLRDEQTGRLARNRAKAAARDAEAAAEGNGNLYDSTREGVDENVDAAANAIHQMRGADPNNNNFTRMGTAPMLPAVLQQQTPEIPQQVGNGVSQVPNYPTMNSLKTNPRKIHNTPGGRQMAYLARKKQRQLEEEQEQQQRQERRQQRGDDGQRYEGEEMDQRNEEEGKEKQQQQQQQQEAREEFANMQIDPLLMLAAANTQMGEEERELERERDREKEGGGSVD